LYPLGQFWIDASAMKKPGAFLAFDVPYSFEAPAAPEYKMLLMGPPTAEPTPPAICECRSKQREVAKVGVRAVSASRKVLPWVRG
jgi:hypothetical protein